MAKKIKPVDIVDEFYGNAKETEEEDREFLQQKIKMYGRQEKMNGALSFAKLVMKMRDAQKRYFEGDKEALDEANGLEATVDKSLRLIIKNYK